MEFVELVEENEEEEISFNLDWLKSILTILIIYI